MPNIVESYQRSVDGFFRALGVEKHGVKVEIVRDKSLVAGSRGVNLWNYPLGQILIHTHVTNPQIHPYLSKDELDFILAHEVVHIFYNHLPASALANLPPTMLDALAILDEKALGLKLLADFLKVTPIFFGSSPPEVSLTKDQEILADVFAICLTGNRTAALEALRKLVNYNLNESSHRWEALCVRLPVMTMGERLREIQHITQEYEKLGCLFR